MDAEYVRAIGKDGAAVSMSYYTAFHAAKSILAHLGEETRTHLGASARFHYLAVYRSDFPKDVARFLGGLRLSREEADYEVHFGDDWDNSTAMEAMAKAKRFVRETGARFDLRRNAN